MCFIIIIFRAVRKILYILLFVSFGVFGQTFEVGDSVVLRNWESSVGVIQEIRDHKSNKNFKVKIHSDSGIFNRWASYSSIIPFQTKKKEVLVDTAEASKIENYPNLIGTLSECDSKSYSSEFNSLLIKNYLTCNDSVDFKNVIIKNGDVLLEGFFKNKPVLFEYGDVVDFFTFSDLVNIPDTGFVSWIEKNHANVIFNGYLNIKAAAEITNLSISNYSWPNVNIKKLDGIEYFTGLDSLSIYNLDLIGFPELPEGLIYLDFSYTRIESLNGLPDELIYLDCHSNNLSSLPELPSKLENLNCSSNNIKRLPELPSKLKNLNCSSNNIATLPKLPFSLEYFNCGSNNIVTLPQLPNNLEYINCSSNKIKTLPELPSKLTYLNGNYNILTHLPTLPEELLELYVNNNNITRLPEIPNKIEVVDCGSNNITRMPRLGNDVKFTGFISNDLPEVEVPVYRLFKTTNMWAFIKLNTRNGKVSQIHYSLDSDGFQGELSINKYSLVSSEDEITGRFTMYPTSNSFNFILLDQITGRTWQVQWNNEKNSRGIWKIN